MAIPFCFVILAAKEQHAILAQLCQRLINEKDLDDSFDTCKVWYNEEKMFDPMGFSKGG